jgi:quercetin dioxygenase-like cupin family protein
MTLPHAALTVLMLAVALPAVAEIIPDTAPTRTNPAGNVHVQYLVGPQATVGKRVAVNRLTFTPGALVPAHTHDEADEILVVTAGKGRLTLAGKTMTVQSGDTVFIPRGQVHAFAADGHSEMIQVYEPAGPEARFKDWKVYAPVTR